MSKDFPATVERVFLDHQGGTKFYEITTVRAGLRSMVIRRYGRVKQFGDLEVKLFDDSYQAISHSNQIFREKTSARKGYRQSGESRSVAAADLDALKLAIGPTVVAKLKPDELKHLDPDADTSTVRDRGDPRFNEDGKFLGEQKPTVITPTKEQEEAAYKAWFEEQRAKNPLFGTF